MLNRRSCSFLTILTVAIAIFAAPSFAQDGKLKVKVTPKQAYLFLDGKAIREGTHAISVPAGKHTVVVVNYGYKMVTKDVDITAGKTTDVDVTLEAYGGKVAGPWGRILIEGDSRAAVLLNGKKPDYFVGHVDEFNNDFIWHQELLVPPGTHQVTVIRGDKELFSGPITVGNNQKIIIRLKSGKTETKDWTGREASLMKKAPLPRFKVGTASATVVVAPAKIDSFSAASAKIDCGQSTNLTWQAEDTVDATIDGDVGTVDASGTKSVSPIHPTTYNLSETGPGGVVKQSTSVDVNKEIPATLNANPSDLHYRKIGDKVIKQESSTLTWSTSNASTVGIDPIGTVTPSGTQTVQGVPKQTTEGPVDESTTYTLNASNVCGGTATATAAIHIVGSIEPIPEVVLASVFYPTAYPDKKNPEAGLLKSQQDALTTAATGFKKYLEYDPDAKLSIAAHADVRGSKKFNQELTERRVTRIKEFLVVQGVPADHVETAAYGKEQEMDRKDIKELETSNPNQAEKKAHHNAQASYYAYNRRADVVMLPSGKKSTQYYPNTASDVKVLYQVPKPSLKVVEKNQ